MFEKLTDERGVIRPKYRVAIVILILLAVLAIALNLYYHDSKYTISIACPIYMWTGYYCPGCGAGRAIVSIMHGNFYQAFRYNPLMVVLMPLIGIYILMAGGCWLVRGNEDISIKIPEWFAAGILILVLVYGIVRNINVYPLILLRPTVV